MTETASAERPPAAMRHRSIGPVQKALRFAAANKMLVAGGVIVFAFAFLAVFAPVIAPYDPLELHIRDRFSPPSWQYPFGTDNIGRDILSRTIHGSRVSFQVGATSVAICVIAGALIGAVAGYVGGLLDDVLMRIADAILAFPPLLLALGLVAAIGPGLWTVSIAIGVVYIPRVARVMRSAVLVEKKKEYVIAARVIGQSGWKILLRHIGPVTISPVIVVATIVFALAIVIEAALSFLGVGLVPPTPSWGIDLDVARHYLHRSIWMPLFPGLAISLAVLGLNLLGDGLRDYLDPKSYGRGGAPAAARRTTKAE